MRVTSQEEYGLRCMMQIAVCSPGRPLTIHEIADREGLSAAYVGKLMNVLRDAGLVDSVRGRSGGYLMARPAAQISLLEILAPLGGNIFEEHHCERFPGEEETCVHTGDCSIRSLWGSLQGLVNRVLSRTTLADLLHNEQEVSAGLLIRHRQPLPMAPGLPGHVPVVLAQENAPPAHADSEKTTGDKS